MAIKRTGYTATTPQHYLMDAGAVYRNLVFEEGEWSGELLGATSDGSTLSIEIGYREIEVDGVKVATRGGEAVETATATLEVNVKEITAKNYAKAINGRVRAALETEAPAGYQVIESFAEVRDEDYDDNVAFVGTLSGSDQPFIAILRNTLVTSPAETEHADDDEATIAMTFKAHADHDDVEANRLPWLVFYPPLRGVEPDPAG